jgi:hypothetical protein
MKRLLIVFLLLLLTPQVPAAAAPAAGGETGNLLTPSADMMRIGQLHAGWRSESREKSWSMAVPLTNSLELSLQRIQRCDGKGTVSEAGAKYLVRSEGVLHPGIAVGVEDMASEYRRSFYAVVSKSLPYGLRLHAGVGNGRFQGGFAALEMRIAPKLQPGIFPDASVYAEHIDGHAAYGVRLSLMRGAKLTTGVDGHNHFIGISYNFY